MPQCRIFFSFDCIILEFPLQDSAACLFVFWALHALNLTLRMILAGLRNKNIKDLAGEIQAFCISSPCRVIAFSYWEILRKMYCQKAKCCFSDRNSIQTSCNIFLTTRCIDGSSWNFSTPTREPIFSLDSCVGVDLYFSVTILILGLSYGTTSSPGPSFPCWVRFFLSCVSVNRAGFKMRHLDTLNWCCCSNFPPLKSSTHGRRKVKS